MIFVTGGAGFLGSNFINYRLTSEQCSSIEIVNLDALTYAGKLENLRSISSLSNYHFVRGEVQDKALLKKIFKEFQPTGVVHFAAETHVDRSIDSARPFFETNVIGTLSLLEESLSFFRELPIDAQSKFRVLHVSTDEVFGALDAFEPGFTEQSRFQPNNPYAASKASADHVVRSFNRTYGLPTITVNSSNIFGPRQYLEKLIPKVIDKALHFEPIPIYGDGLQTRDWLYVDDFCSSLELTLGSGRIGDTYNVGSNSELSNLHLAKEICRILDEVTPTSEGPRSRLITFVADRPGHDRRYAINPSKLMNELKWSPKTNFADGLRLTVEWYLQNASGRSATDN
ncbi:MAG: dTDP-glucose 4,6-dehydratase [Proteobacteria bacterium]|nr:MAG: dTDP-glucose 4,6-dehydratase [Pseudomonadota bacterium]